MATMSDINAYYIPVNQSIIYACGTDASKTSAHFLRMDSSGNMKFFKTFTGEQ